MSVEKTILSLVEEVRKQTGGEPKRIVVEPNGTVDVNARADIRGQAFLSAWNVRQPSQK